jgi:hypothetical protein
MISFTPRPLYPPEEPPVTIEQEAVWAPEPVWKLWNREKSSAHAGNQTSAIEPVAISTEIFGLREVIYLYLIKHYNLKTCRSGDINSTILNLSTNRSGQLHVLAALPQGIQPTVPIV